MKSWPLWIAGTLVLAVIVHIMIILGMPYAIMDRAMSRIAVAGATNIALHAPKADALARGMKRPSPELLYSACVFDLSKQPLRITSPVPDSYWSLSLFAANTDNFFVLNDRQAGAARVDVILAMDGQNVPERANQGHAPVIIAPSEMGIILFRTLITSEDRLADLDQLRRKARCTPL